MRNFKKVLGLAIAILSGVSVFAQQTTLSPYTRYGYGNLYENSFGPSSAMGGVTYGIRTKTQINPGNPASYSITDSTTFLFDMGVFLQAGSFYQGASKNPNGELTPASREHKISGNFEYAAMQFPIMKNMGASVGIMPFSSVGYRYGNRQDIVGGVDNIYEGSGGLSQVYAGLAYKFFDRVSVGANFAYLFGNITHMGGSYFLDPQIYDSYISKNLNLKGFKTDIGVQYIQPIGKKDRLIIGAVFSPKVSPKTRLEEYRTIVGTSSSSSKIDTVNIDPATNHFSIPQSFGVGASYQIADKWLLAADYSYQNWKDAKYYNTTDTLNIRQKISLGAEYTPDITSRSFFKRTKYRVGAHLSDSYLKMNDTGLREYGLSLGLGFPITSPYGMTVGSMVNISFEYINSRPKVGTLIKEDYFRVTLNMTFNELWFFKRKLD